MKMAALFLISCTIADVLPTLRPGAFWNFNGVDYSGIEWLEKTQAKPSQMEIDLAISNCLIQEPLRKAQKEQAILDAKNQTKTAEERLNALLKVIDLK